MTRLHPGGWLTVLAALTLLPGLAEAAPKKKKELPPGFVLVDSTAPGAAIEIDGVSMGQTPAPPISIAVGKHAIKVSKRGFLAVLDVVEVTSAQETKFFADLFAEKAILKVTSPVEAAEVFLDGKLLGETPIDTDIDPGRRSIRVSLQGYRDFVKVIEAVAGEAVELDAPLVSLTPTPPPGKTKKVPGGHASKAWYKKWWVWAIAGGAATAVTIGVVATSGEDDPLADFDPDRRFDIP